MVMENSIIIPTLRYKDAAKAIDWLCSTFGFKNHLVIPGDKGTIVHAQLILQNSMIMLSTKSDTEYDQYVKSPKEVNGVNTQCPYIIIEQIDEHYLHSKNSGAEIVTELRDEEYGGKVYSCKDPEGYLWNFGSYNPWK
jgi:uncharacterized glyoxalase superfamily protein PhnB